MTLLVGAVVTPVAGRLADMFGKKRIMLLSLVPLVVGSVVCALAMNVPVMIIGRGLQGLATGFIPIGISLLHDLLPMERTAGAIALMSSSLGIGGALGLPFAAAVAQFGSWRILFWVMAAGSLAILVLVWSLISHSGSATAKRAPFDVVGALGISIGLVALLLAVSKGSVWGWAAPLTLSMFALAVVVLAAWGWWELRTASPLVDLRTTARPVVLLTNLASVLIGFSMYAQSLILPQLMQLPVGAGYGHGQTMLQMGLWMAPSSLAMTLMSPVGARITGRFGAKTTLALGAAVMAVGYGASTLSLPTLVGLAATAFVTSAGVGLAYGAMPNLILGAVPASEKAAANGLNTLMRSIGTSAAAAVIGVVLANLTTSFGGVALASTEGFVVSLLIGCAAALAAMVIAFTIPRHPRDRDSAHEARESIPAAA